MTVEESASARSTGDCQTARRPWPISRTKARSRRRCAPAAASWARMRQMKCGRDEVRQRIDQHGERRAEDAHQRPAQRGADHLRRRTRSLPAGCSPRRARPARRATGHRSDRRYRRRPSSLRPETRRRSAARCAARRTRRPGGSSPAVPRGRCPRRSSPAAAASDRPRPRKQTEDADAAVRPPRPARRTPSARRRDSRRPGAAAPRR